MTRIIKAALELTLKNTGYRQGFVRSCTTTSASSSDIPVRDVPGLSRKTVEVPSKEVGFPAASKKGMYKNPEYFCYHNVSYFEAEVEMMKYRLPQPSNKSTK